MTPELRDNLYKFLWDESMLYHEEEMNLIANWIDENIVNEQERLKEALIQSVEVIKEWHNRGAYITGKSQSVIEEIWLIYFENAPELKGIREALKV